MSVRLSGFPLFFMRFRLNARHRSHARFRRDHLERAVVARRSPYEPRHTGEVREADERPVKVAILGASGHAGTVPYRQRNYRTALPPHQRRQEAVLVVEISKAQIELAREDLEPAARVRRAVLQ
jgi:hypothetical protein